MQKLAHQHFGRGVLAPDAGHIVTAGLFAVYIGHDFSAVKLINRFIRFPGVACPFPSAYFKVL